MVRHARAWWGLGGRRGGEFKGNWWSLVPLNVLISIVIFSARKNHEAAKKSERESGRLAVPTTSVNYKARITCTNRSNLRLDLRLNQDPQMD